MTISPAAYEGIHLAPVERQVQEFTVAPLDRERATRLPIRVRLDGTVADTARTFMTVGERVEVDWRGEAPRIRRR